MYDKINKKRGLITSMFLIGYGLIRYFVEMFRLDANYINSALTFGQLFSILIFIAGLGLVIKNFTGNKYAKQV